MDEAEKIKSNLAAPSGQRVAGAKDYAAEWLRRGTWLITIACLSAEIAALANQEDAEYERPETAAVDNRAALALRNAIGHLAQYPGATA